MNARRATQWAAATVLIAALTEAEQAGISFWQATADNTEIIALESGRDITAAGDAPAPVLAARAQFLVAQGKIDAARSIADKLSAPASAPLRASVLYAIGNAHLRQAMQIYLLVPLAQVKPLVNAAKAEFRQALELDPGNWDCRYNFAIAATLIHDTEAAKAISGAQMSHDRASWPDIPGAPNGMP
jgi:mxaK protein